MQIEVVLTIFGSSNQDSYVGLVEKNGRYYLPRETLTDNDLCNDTAYRLLTNFVSLSQPNITMLYQIGFLQPNRETICLIYRAMLPVDSRPKNNLVWVDGSSANQYKEDDLLSQEDANIINMALNNARPP
jgi:hypothetical protein